MGDNIIGNVARLFSKSNAMKDPKRNLQLLEGIIIAEGWDKVPIDGIYGSSDRTMLHMAVLADEDGNFFDVIEFLIKNGINVNAKDSYGNTALHFLADVNGACTDSQFKIAKLILDNGGDLNIQNNSNIPALRSTIKHSKDEYRLMKLFFMYSLDDEILSDLEKTAEIVGNKQVIELIEQRRSQTV